MVLFLIVDKLIFVKRTACIVVDFIFKIFGAFMGAKLYA